ncbi:hypothetical protein GGX14DRAFT_558971 [Mycena pura]|uniref:Uncharacterized protein n=1 Tax=Mycena pura TaxID=153505 RepID=A0AAD6VSJ2_9AGAR|nr:hypothetical protein GGX14DRAFT_558971 [Mycena pura]
MSLSYAALGRPAPSINASSFRCPCQSCGWILKLQYSRKRREYYYVKHQSNSHLPHSLLQRSLPPRSILHLYLQIAPSSPLPRAVPAPAVKQEQPDDDGFIIDAASAFGSLASASLARGCRRWELAYPPTPSPQTHSAAAYQRAVHHSPARPYLVRLPPVSRPPIHTHAHVQGRTRTSGYDTSVLRRWSLPVHAHAQKLFRVLPMASRPPSTKSF